MSAVVGEFCSLTLSELAHRDPVLAAKLLITQTRESTVCFLHLKGRTILTQRFNGKEKGNDRSGSNDVIVYLNGFRSNPVGSFLGWIGPVAREHQIDFIRYTHPCVHTGQMDSFNYAEAVDDVLTVMDHSGADRIVPVAFSFGGGLLPFVFSALQKNGCADKIAGALLINPAYPPIIKKYLMNQRGFDDFMKDQSRKSFDVGLVNGLVRYRMPRAQWQDIEVNAQRLQSTETLYEGNPAPSFPIIVLKGERDFLNCITETEQITRHLSSREPDIIAITKGGHWLKPQTMVASHLSRLLTAIK